MDELIYWVGMAAVAVSAPAWAGALGFVALLRLGVGPAGAAFVAMGAVIVIRLAAIRWRITLPMFVARR
jgi:uncharacterized membrane protein YeiH